MGHHRCRPPIIADSIRSILQDGKFMVNEFTTGTVVQLGPGVGTDGTNTVVSSVDHAAGYSTCWHLQSPV